ncbi:hypothetical protein [Paracoccus sp. (in: a-proteobacteria)]|uniref:hypothetical protein n=1 Tax=Paracoccus sp. TaxID=267 RepID=UPI0026DEA807|nr:hypothetical protein [Paracoccus sp. (in: a-proteobacteria)]MDO5648364.1 hypothetical protein [Paracoccus sp. (in: a-proteobacteria)]
MADAAPEWLVILRRECNARPIAQVARQLGYARTSVSLAVHGRYGGTGARLAARVMAVFDRPVTCPHLGAPISRAHCADFRTRPLPTNSAADLKHWIACKTCPVVTGTTQTERTA